MFNLNKKQLGKSSTTFWDQFFFIRNFNQYPVLSSLLQNYEGENLLSYSYIDHEQGITLEILNLFTEKNKEIAITKNFVADKSRIIVRFEHFAGIYFELADLEKLFSLNINLPEYIQFYLRSDLSKFRKHEIYQKFSAKGFPDDIAVLLIDETQQYKTEKVWVRVEYFDAEKEEGKAKLLVQPFQKLKINKGDEIYFKLVETQNEEIGFQPVGFYQSSKKSTEEHENSTRKNK